MKFNQQLLTGAVSTALLAFAHGAYATNGDQMIGVTATQQGMAGAFTAVPQDAATMLFNPAGVAELGIEDVRFDLGFGVMNPERSANDVESDSKYYLMPAGAAAFKIDDRLSVGMAMGGISGMGVDFSDISPLAGNQAVVTTKQFYKIVPGLAYRATDQWTLGAALNIDYQSLAIHTAQYTLPQNQVYGFGFSLGAIYKPTASLQIGASYISKQNMSAFEWNTAGSPTSSGRISFTMDAPEQYALGVAFRPAQGWLIEADIKRINFSDVLGTIDVDRPAGYVPGIPAQLKFGWEDQTVYAIGVQTELGTATTLRFGFNYGESPIGPEDVDTNIGSLAVVEEHASVALTRQLGKKVSGSLSYMKAFHNEVQSSTSANKIELEQNIVNLQLTYRL